ncbi:MAG: ribonuclease HII [Deltaproteobacteria bacterium]|jgi:ribonuclease HII|nr:ribonuclease HII [Deltaproteobacteria bacterium]MCW9048751.1 ribonuclease HII [Deltaproteobacteria bacterium]
MNLDLFNATPVSTLLFETQAKELGYRAIAGVDEAGRGPLAGPVVAAAVILPDHFNLPGLNDSKKVTAKKRESLYPQICQQAAAFGVGVATAGEIDQINILQATLLAMRRAIARLSISPDHLLIDGITPLSLDISQQTIKKGDSRSLSVAAASIIAKVVRDRIMLSFDRQLPVYGFSQHKGYGTLQHRQAIRQFGPSWQHRKTFAGVKEHLGQADD